MADDSKVDDPATKQKAVDEVTAGTSAAPAAEVESENEDEQEDATPAVGTSASGAAAKKKKKSKKNRIKAALAGGSGEGPSSSSTKDDISKALSGLSKSQVSQLLSMNPALAQEFSAADGDLSLEKTVEPLKRLNLEDVMTGLAASGKNVKDMGSYKFWQTQPVPKLGDKMGNIEEGPIKAPDMEKVPKEPGPLLDGFEWVTMDLTSDDELKEVFDLLYGHYVEDEEARFRFNYSTTFLRWALLAPGWTKDWHVGVRASTSRKLVAFISGVPVELRVRQNVFRASEVNFLCVHKKLRSKRLTPVLIKEITRRCHLQGVWQAIYTAGIVLPKPVSTSRYFHRALDWEKLYEVGFSPLPLNSKPKFQVLKYKLPDHTATKGLRPMEAKDVDAVQNLLKRYLARFDMAAVFTREEVDHWLLHKKDAPGERVVWTYVVENANTKKITDFISFYCIESSVIGNLKHNNVRAAYLYYYASEIGLQPKVEKSALKTQLNALVNDALILAKKLNFDVFNAVSVMDNSLFIEQQKFGGGDGQMHYYLYNYNANPIAGGVDKKNQVDENCSGNGFVML